VARVVRDEGVQSAIGCANCHDPERALGGMVEEVYATGEAPPGDGVSCISCHAAYDAPVPTGNGLARYRVPKDYPGGSPRARRRNLLADPRQHRQGMQASRHLMSDEGCGVCHRTQLDLVGGGRVLVQNPYRAEGDPGPERSDDESGVSCGLCHMPTRTRQAGAWMPLYDHRWPGVNVDLAAYVTHPEADSTALADVRVATEVFMRGGLGTSHMPDEVSVNPEYGAYADLAGGAGLLAVEIETSREGDELVVTVRTTNHRSAHPFPIGPIDLQETWLKIEVRDYGGRVVSSVGELRDGRVDPDAPRLGARALDAAGQPLREHRLAELAAVEDRRIVWPWQTVEDVVRLEVPADIGPVRVRAGWNFRRVNPEFAEFVFGTPDAVERFGVHPIGGAEVVIE
jgi:cytochrome c551/c552